MRFRRDDALHIIMQFGEGDISHLLQVAKCLVIHLVSTALIRLVVDSVEARYSERNSICHGVTGAVGHIQRAFHFFITSDQCRKSLGHDQFSIFEVFERGPDLPHAL